MRHFSSPSTDSPQTEMSPYYSYRSQKRESLEKPPKKRLHLHLHPFRYIFYLLLIISPLLFLRSIDWSFIPATFDAALSAFTKSPIKAPSETGLFNPQLSKNINALIGSNNQYQIGVSLIDISSGQTQTFGSNIPFEAASTGKIITACAFYHEVETGTADLNESMGDYTAQFQLQEMINDSDNSSWQLLVDAIGDQELQTYATSIGVTYDEPNNTLTPQAMATLLSKLYSGSLLNKTDTDQLLSYMQNTNDEELIPAALPSSVTVYHKYGLLDDELHDASILVDGGKAYVFVVYTKDSEGVQTNDPRVDIIHQLTKTVVETLFPGSYSTS